METSLQQVAAAVQAYHLYFVQQDSPQRLRGVRTQLEQLTRTVAAVRAAWLDRSVVEDVLRQAPD